MFLGRRLVVAVLVAAVLAGCGGSDDRAQSGSNAAPSTASPSTAAPPTTSSSQKIQTSTCTDKRGDGTPADIRSVVLRRVGDRLVARFQLTSRPPTAGTVHWAIL